MSAPVAELSPRQTHDAANACAAAVIDVLPAAMNAMRSAMRLGIPDGLSVPQFRCLNYIDLHDGASLGEVSAFLGVTLATASAMVERLAQAGHVESAVSARDRRRAELHSLPAGRRMLASMREATQAEFAQLLSRYPQRDLAALLRGLQLLKTTFKTQSR